MRERTAVDGFLDVCAMGQEPVLGDVNDLPAARDADTDEVREARSAILTAGRESARLRMRGEHGLARRLAKETASEYRALFATDRPQPPNPDGLSPREIANLITDRRPGA